MCIDYVAVLTTPVAVVMVFVEVEAGRFFLTKRTKDRKITSSSSYSTPRVTEVLRHTDSRFKLFNSFTKDHVQAPFVLSAMMCSSSSGLNRRIPRVAERPLMTIEEMRFCFTNS